MELISKILSLVSKPPEKVGTPDSGLRMLKELQTKLDAKIKICDRCNKPLNDHEIKSPRIVINYFENWLLCNHCR